MWRYLVRGRGTTTHFVVQCPKVAFHASKAQSMVVPAASVEPSA